ncbi:uncharacterized protein [Watersipora subatra]|uniref:uncharacterized protein n=1 Tax=Watersipora subatra TaxID=2589382 RepID=UPI00355ADE63
MGDIVSKSFHNYPNGLAKTVTNPKQKDWITKHATLTRFSIVEVERLWTRFKQLGCDENGVLDRKSILQMPRFKDNVLLRNMLLAMADGEQVYFHTFLNAMRWVNTASVDERTKAIFALFNNGSALTEDLFGKILKRIYPDKNEAALTLYVKTVFDSGSKAAGRPEDLTYENFLRLVHQLPSEQLSSILEFDVIPPHINLESKDKFSPQLRARQDTSAAKDLSEEAMVSLDSYSDLAAALASSPDWEAAMTALGFSDSQIDRIHMKYSDSAAKIRALLKSWRNLQEEDATVGAMKASLRSVRPDLIPHIYG